MQKKIRKIYCVRGSSGYARWMQGEIVKNMEEADLVVLPGGSDVPTKYYAKSTHPSTWGFSSGEEEYNEIQKALSLGKKIWGTCKGLQWSSVISGGSLIQDLNHPGSHKITTEDGKTLIVNSLHHQAVYPFDLPKDEYRIIGWAENLSPHHQDGDCKEMEVSVEPEIVYFPKTKILGTQFHCELMSETHPTVQYCQDLLDRFMEDKL